MGEIDAGDFCPRRMELADKPGLKAPHTASYSAAIARAVEWLGDRYLLAKPINAAADRAAGAPQIAAASPPSPRRTAARSM